MEQLSRQDEELVLQFNGLLWGVSGPEDLFPPDDLDGVREPRRPVAPRDAEPQAIALASVYDLTEARRERLNVTNRCTPVVGSVALGTIEDTLARIDNVLTPA